MDDPHLPRRRFGQNFLTDRRVVRRILDAFQPMPGDPVVEIGPGRGALTLPLVARGVCLVALEIDPRLAGDLERLLAGQASVSVQQGDALEVDLEQLAARVAGPEERARLIGNLPYNVATAILRRVLVCRGYRDVQILVQDEVADRLTHGPGEDGYGPLAVLCALRGGARRLFRVGPGAFRPRPRVVSAAVHLDLDATAPLPATGVPALERLLREGFAERRKTLVNNLVRSGHHRVPVAQVIQDLGLAPQVRAERVPPEAWLLLRSRLGSPLPGDD
jgi:16S rRNA (adenine1518-N6/adenine1519-N6)-dimethyltransferase